MRHCTSEYDISTASGTTLAGPDWPKVPFGDLIKPNLNTYGPVWVDFGP